MDRLQEIATRKAEIKALLEGEETPDLEAIKKELDELEMEEKQINEQVEEETRKAQAEAEQRKAEAEALANGQAKGNEIDMKKEENKMNELNYRDVWLKKLQGRQLTEEERGFVQSGSQAVIPDEISERIIEKIVKLVPLINEVELYRIKGNLKVAVEGTVNDAATHTELGTINASADTLIKVDLAGFEITKLLQISKSVEQMSTNAFEDWLTTNLAKSIARKIEALILNGAGTTEAKGLLQENLTTTTYSTLTADNVRAFIGTLPAGYDPNAIMVMNKKTLFNKFMGLQDNAKNSLIKEDGAVKYCYGYRICLSDKMADDVVVLGDWKYYVANMVMGEEVVRQFDIDTNSYKYLGCAIFDGKCALTDAFVKLAPASSI